MQTRKWIVLKRGLSGKIEWWLAGRKWAGPIPQLRDQILVDDLICWMGGKAKTMRIGATAMPLLKAVKIVDD